MPELERIEWVPGQLALPGLPAGPPSEKVAARCGDRFRRGLFLSSCDLDPGHGGDDHIHYVPFTDVVFDRWPVLR